MRIETVTCDGCGADITSTGNCEDYRLALVNEGVPSRGGFVTAMGKYPALKRGHHFCGTACLDQWSDRRRLKAKLWQEHHEKWVAERGTKTGNFTSFPAPPEEQRQRLDDEFDATALAAFPMQKSKKG